MPSLSLPHLRTAILGGSEAVIVALGSSSTQGVAASLPSRTYPAQLQADLSSDLPDLHVAILNRGISGQDVTREAARIDADVVAVRPQLVIWQVGANAALRHADVEGFRAAVAAGVRRMLAARIDVVLMDNQRAPRVMAIPGEDQAIDHALAEVGAATGASVFSRDRLMAGWAAEGFAPAAFLAADGLHHNDRGYLCVARALARAILRAIRPQSLVAGP